MDNDKTIKPGNIVQTTFGEGVGISSDDLITASGVMVDPRARLIELTLDLYEAASQEITICPYCAGSIGSSSHQHQDYCTLEDEIRSLKDERGDPVTMG